MQLSYGSMLKRTRLAGSRKSRLATSVRSDACLKTYHSWRELLVRDERRARSSAQKISSQKFCFPSDQQSQCAPSGPNSRSCRRNN